MVLVATCLKIAMLFRYKAFKADFRSNSVLSVAILGFSCYIEHAVFTAAIFYWLSASFPDMRSKDHFDSNVRMYHAIAFPELSKVFVAFLQVWDTEPTMPFIYAALMLSVQYSSLRCITSDDSVAVFKPFLVAVLLRTMCRLCFHSIHHTLALGLII